MMPTSTFNAFTKRFQLRSGSVLVFVVALLTATIPMYGNEKYISLCSSCHQISGEGVEGVFPPLTGWVNRIAKMREGRSYLISVISYGLNEEIDVNGISYIGYMPPNPQLTNREISDLLNYIVKDLSKDASVDAFTESEVGSVRSVRRTMKQVGVLRNQVLSSLR